MNIAIQVIADFSLKIIAFWLNEYSETMITELLLNYKNGIVVIYANKIT